MPSLPHSRAYARNDLFSTSTNTTEKPQNMSPAHIWMLIGIVGGIVVLAIVVAFAMTYLLKRRRLRQAQHNDPYLSHKDFTRRRKRRKMSKAERVQEEELERRAIIRKSLASKTSSRTSQAISERLSMDDEAETSPTNSLKDDWKEWEARLQRERSDSVQDHPLILTRLDMAIPSQTRSQSPSRRAAVISKTASRPATLPSLPSLPPLPPLPAD